MERPILVKAGKEGMEIEIYPSHPLYSELLLELERGLHPEVADDDSCEQLVSRTTDEGPEAL